MRSKSYFLFDLIEWDRYHIESNLPTPQTNDSLRRFTQLIYLSQINQAMTLKSIGDFCRMHSSEAMIDPKTSEG